MERIDDLEAEVERLQKNDQNYALSNKSKHPSPQSLRDKEILDYIGENI